jgi:D-3-phosphoglycerate dehydrogenase
MPHVVVAGKIHPSGIALLKDAEGFTYDYVEEVSEPSYAPLVAGADALVLRTQPLSAATVAQAGRLRIVSRHGVGYDAVHLPSLNERGIALAIVGDVNSVSVAEHAMMLLLALAKRTNVADRAVRTGDWKWRDRLDASELAGKHLLIIGFGRIGRHLARLASAFGMKVMAHDPYLERLGWPDQSAAMAYDLDAALGWADAVSVHAPKGERPLMGERELRAMKRSAVLINTSRGGVVDEAALVAALAENRLAGAGLDVFETEPPARDNPLFGFDQVILSPHIAGLTAECAERMAISSVQNIIDFFAGRIDEALVVNARELTAGRADS